MRLGVSCFTDLLSPITDYCLPFADGVINVALYHCLGPSIQTALFNGPLVVLVGWAMGKPMDPNFEIFMICLLVLSILVVGNFLRDGESDWLRGRCLLYVFPPCAIRLLYQRLITTDRIRYCCHCELVLSKPGCCNL